MPTSMPGLWNSIRALMFCLQTALPPPPAPEGIPLPLVFSTQPFLPLLSSPFLPLPSMAIRWCSGRFPGFLSPTSGHTTNHKTEMLWAIQPTDMLWAIQPTGMLWAIQPTGMLWAIQPTEALGYPAHRNALGYPAHRNALGYPAHRNVLGYPAHRNALGYPAHRNIYIYIQHTLPCASTHLIFSLHMSPYLFSFFSL